MLNAKLEHHLTGSHTLSHEDSVYIYIYILIDLMRPKILDFDVKLYSSFNLDYTRLPR